MKFRYFIAVLVGLLVGCSNSGTTATPKIVDLGTVDLSYDSPSKHDVGNGLSCVITAGSLGSTKECELIARVEKSGKALDTRRVVPALLDQPAHFQFEKVEVTFTPHIKQ